MNATTIVEKYYTQIRRDADNAYCRNVIMDLRDERIRLQRKVAELKDILFWEPENFTEAHRKMLHKYERKIAIIKTQEQNIRSYIYA